MRVQVFSTIAHKTWEIIHSFVKAEVSGVEVEAFGTLEKFSGRLEGPKDDLLANILVASNRQELSDLLGIKDLLWETPTLFILPDTGKDTLSTVHHLYPRYTADVNSDFTDLALEIKELLNSEVTHAPLLDLIDNGNPPHYEPEVEVSHTSHPETDHKPLLDLVDKGIRPGLAGPMDGGPDNRLETKDKKEPPQIKTGPDPSSRKAVPPRAQAGRKDRWKQKANRPERVKRSALSITIAALSVGLVMFIGMETLKTFQNPPAESSMNQPGNSNPSKKEGGRRWGSSSGGGTPAGGIKRVPRIKTASGSQAAGDSPGGGASRQTGSAGKDGGSRGSGENPGQMNGSGGGSGGSAPDKGAVSDAPSGEATAVETGEESGRDDGGGSGSNDSGGEKNAASETPEGKSRDNGSGGGAGQEDGSGSGGESGSDGSAGDKGADPDTAVDGNRSNAATGKRDQGGGRGSGKSGSSKDPHSNQPIKNNRQDVSGGKNGKGKGRGKTAKKAKLTNFMKKDPSVKEIYNALRPDTNECGGKKKTDAQPITKRIDVDERAKNRPGATFDLKFDFNSSSLKKKAKRLLRKLGKAITRNELACCAFLLEGHTDAVDSEDYNYKLSEQRAQAVKAYLVSEFGVSPEMLITAGKGESSLLDTKKPTSAINRRVVIVNLGPHPALSQ